MRTFNLVKSLSTLVSNITSLPFREGLGLGSLRSLILCLSLAVLGVDSAWAWRGARVIVKSEPTSGGWVWVTKTSGNAPSSWEKTDDSSEENNLKISDQTWTFYMYANPQTNYIFKGWATSASTNTVSYTGQTNQAVSAKGTKGASYNEYTYYAIFARMTADISSKDFGNVNVGQSSSATTITVTHAHASKITAALSGANASDFTLSKTTIVENSVSEGTATFTVTFKPTCNGTRTATLTLSSSNGLNNVTISLSGTGVLNSQTLSWNNESSIELNMLKGTTQNISASASSGLAVSYSSSNSDVLSVDASGKLTAKSVGEATITASQSGDCTYSAATSISKTFNVKSKDTPIFTPNWSSTNIKVGDKVTLGVQYVSDGLTGDFKAKDYDSNILKVTREGNTITIEALNAGSSDVTFTQTETSAIFSASQKYSFSITKITNTLSVADASHSMKVEEQWGSVISGKNSDAIVTTTSSDETVAYYDVANNKIVAPHSGQVTITIHQEETYKYTAVNKTITVTVNKWDNTLTWSGPSSLGWWSSQSSVQASGNSDAAISYSVVNERYGSYDATNHILYSHNINGQLQVTATQAETYKYKGTSVTLTVNVSKADDHVPFTINSSTAYNNQHPIHGGAGSASWSDGISFDQGGFNWDDNYVDLSFTGIPDKLTFTTTLGGANTSVEFYVKEYVNNTWSDKKWSNSKASTETIQLSPSATKIRLCYSGNLSATFKNVAVTELRTFSTDKSSLDFGSNKKDIACASQTLTFNYANVGHKVTLSTNDPHFTVSPTSITNIGGEKYGSQTITVSYSTAEVHTASNAKLTITDELGNSKEITLSGSTAKKTQTISWVSPYDVEEPAIPIGKTITGAATSSSNLGVIYESSNSSVIEILNDGTAFKALTAGSATITAKQIGTDDWEAASISKTFKGTNKIIQVISWNQNFTRLLTTYNAQDLTAIVNLENAETGVQTYSKERSDLITYTSQDNSVVSVDGATLNIVGKGETTLTATVPGDDLYESATVTIPVKVREPSAGCEDVLLTTDLSNGEYEFHRDLDTKEIFKIVQIDRTSTAYPGAVTFQHRGKKSWGFYDGEIEVYESVDGGANYNTLVGHVKPNESSEYGISTFSINRNTTHLKFYRPAGSTGYHYIKNVEVIPAQFIESNAADNTIDFGNVTVNSVEERTVVLSYANVKDNLTITKSSDDLTLSCGGIIDLDCGATGTNTITISFTPTSVGDFSDDITFFDKNSKQNYTLNIKAKVVKSTQHITWEPTKTEYRTIDQIELNATASSTNPVQYYVTKGKDVADFENEVLIIKKDGQITIRAYEPGDALWAPAADVDKTFTIRKTNLHFDPLPTAATITYPQTLNESALTDGVVKDEDGNVVEGTITWTTPTTQLNAGENQSQEITFTPTTNPAWYNTLSSTTTVSVQKAEPIATPSASDITYGQKVNESVLTNEGTSGTWSWTDTHKDDVLNVGTYDDLAVHFTPDNKNYTEADATVSLTVYRATPSLTWTSAPTEADVKAHLTYTATSNHTESEITYSITAGADCATIDASTGVLTITKAGTITVQASQAASDNYEAAVLSQTTILTGEFENRFTGDGGWNNAGNWTNGIPTEENPNVVISGSLTITEPISVGDLTIENTGKVNIVNNGDLTVNGTSDDRETYGNLFVRKGGNITINENANVKVYDFVVESSIGTEGTSISGQVKNSDRVFYTNGAYIDIYMDPEGEMDDTQWYGFTVPFPVDVQNGIARKEGDVFRKCTYGVEYMICEYDMTQRLNSGKGWKYIKSGRLQPGRFYYFTVNGNNNVYSFKAADNTITIHNETQLVVNGEGPNANWNAVGNSTLTYTTISGENVPSFVQTYINGESRYMTVATDDAQFVVGCPFFFQAMQEATMILNEANGTVNAHYAPRQESLDKPVCVRIAEEGKHFSDQIYLTASQETTGKYTLGRDLAKAGIGTKSAQLWINAYNQKLSVHEATLMGEQAYYELSIYAPKAGSYELSLPKVPADAAIYLTQNGYPIWNLNESPYVIECYKGTTNEYGLLLRLQEGGSPTDMQTMRSSEKVQKIMKDQRIYINANSQLYDLMGQKVK